MLRLQRPAIERLLEAQDNEKVAEILANEFSQDGEVDFFGIDEQMEEHELSAVSLTFTEYILTHHFGEFGINANRLDTIR